jgi:hypothetical protein
MTEQKTHADTTLHWTETLQRQLIGSAAASSQDRGFEGGAEDLGGVRVGDVRRREEDQEEEEIVNAKITPSSSTLSIADLIEQERTRMLNRLADSAASIDAYDSLAKYKLELGEKEIFKLPWDEALAGLSLE